MAALYAQGDVEPEDATGQETGGQNIEDLSVEQLMTRSVATCGPDAHVHQIMQEMTKGHFRHMPVLEDGKLIGMISIGDVVKSRLDELETEGAHLRNFIAGAE